MAVRKSAAKAAPAPKVEFDEDNGARLVSVNRDFEGNCTEVPGFRLLVQEGATDADKAAAWNLRGELPPEEIIVYIPKPQV